MSDGAVWINGDFVDRSDARISAFDASVQHAVGLFETMHSVGENVWRLDRHLERIIDSARTLGLSESLKFNALREAVRRVLKEAGLDRGRVRLTITGGDLNMLAASGKGPQDPTVLIVAQPATAYPREMMEKGVMATIADGRVNPLDPFAGHKTLNYWPRLRALQIASSAGAGETIFLQVTNHLAGGSVSNLFLVKDGVLLTPIARGEEEPGALTAPVLPGVTRGAVIEAAEAIGVGCARKMLSVEEMLEADEAFLTNSSWGVLPVVRIEKSPIGDGVPGELTGRLRDAIDRDRASA